MKTFAYLFPESNVLLSDAYLAKYRITPPSHLTTLAAVRSRSPESQEESLTTDKRSRKYNKEMRKVWKEPRKVWSLFLLLSLLWLGSVQGGAFKRGSGNYLYEGKDDATAVIEFKPGRDFKDSKAPKIVIFYSPFCG